MSNSPRETAPTGAPSPPLEELLDKNKEATAEVKRAADDLAVVHAVLDTKIAEAAPDGDVKRAIAETDKVEKRLTESAEKLDEVNEALAGKVFRTP